jgi:hypothetical protein
MSIIHNSRKQSDYYDMNKWAADITLYRTGNSISLHMNIVFFYCKRSQSPPIRAQAYFKVRGKKID